MHNAIIIFKYNVVLCQTLVILFPRKSYSLESQQKKPLPKLSLPGRGSIIHTVQNMEENIHVVSRSTRYTGSRVRFATSFPATMSFNRLTASSAISRIGWWIVVSEGAMSDDK